MRPPALPRTIACIGRNFTDHIKELHSERPSEPFFFLKPAGSIIFPDTGPVEVPKGVNAHHEVELGIVLGKTVDGWRGKSVEEMVTEEGLIKGYVVGIDMTARNLQEISISSRLPWTLAKGFKTFTPISHLIPKLKIPNPQNVELYLSVNGQMKQQDSTNLMLFDIPRLLRHITSVTPLYEDDLVLTGTPKGVGRLVAGDKVVAGVRVDGEEVAEGRIEVGVVDRVDGYGSDACREN